MNPYQPFIAARQAVFLDKDGTLVEDVPYNVRPEHIRLLPGAIEGLRLLYHAGYELIVITNQSGIGRGLFTEDEHRAAVDYLHHLLAKQNVPLAGYYYCPHAPPELRSSGNDVSDCDCRKPLPGLLLRAAQERALELGRCWMVGDILDDIEAGKRAGCRTVLIDNGHETEWVIAPTRTPDHTTANLVEAARTVLGAPPAEGLASVGLGEERWR